MTPIDFITIISAALVILAAITIGYHKSYKHFSDEEKATR